MYQKSLTLIFIGLLMSYVHGYAQSSSSSVRLDAKRYPVPFQQQDKVATEQERFHPLHVPIQSTNATVLADSTSRKAVLKARQAGIAPASHTKAVVPTKKENE